MISTFLSALGTQRCITLSTLWLRTAKKEPSDIFALGSILYELVTGKAPYGELDKIETNNLDCIKAQIRRQHRVVDFEIELRYESSSSRTSQAFIAETSYWVAGEGNLAQQRKRWTCTYNWWVTKALFSNQIYNVDTVNRSLDRLYLKCDMVTSVYSILGGSESWTLRFTWKQLRQSFVFYSDGDVPTLFIVKPRYTVTSNFAKACLLRLRHERFYP